MTVYFSTKQLLSPPTERAAFSDRQAYVCAELARLAYFKFEGGFELEEVLNLARQIFGDDKRLAPLEQQLREVLAKAPSTAAQAEAALNSILNAADMTLVKTFCTNGTQAFLCAKELALDPNANKTIAFLVFRGTEPKDFRDIKTDVRAAFEKLVVDGETLEVHQGYLAAFRDVEAELQTALETLAYDQLFLTGHSLGGALAVLATRLLASDTTGACYTFGAPPVGTAELQNKLKTPIYQIINEIDIVPRLPNPWAATGILFLIRLARLLAKSVTLINHALFDGNWDEKLENFIQAMTKYRHPGYVSYLVGQGQSARLRYNVSSFDRLRWWSAMMLKGGFGRFTKMVSDHSMEQYLEKLRVHALKRL